PGLGAAAAQPAAPSPGGGGGGNSAFWPAFAAGLAGKVPPSVQPFLNNPAKVTGVWKNGFLTLWVDSEFTRAMLNKPTVTQPLAQAAAAFFGAAEARVSVVVGQPPAEEGSAPPAAGEKHDALDDLLAFGAQFDNIKIQ
ncbi:hypothetical protein B5F19_16695, partial [Pseudoflavonifractor sp. An184]